MSSSSDHNLLFGILALQMDFVQREQLVAATSAWLTDKSKSLSEILVRQGALQEADRQLLEPLVDRHVENHEGDPQRSLAALSSVGTVAEELRSLGDPGVAATLSVVTGSDSGGSLYEPKNHQSSRVTGDDGKERFRVLRTHAKGGLGEVYVARDVELNREVALKEIQARYADDEENRTRFLLEAEVTGGLEHPGIVPVYGLGRYEDGRPFYAMKFVRGNSLRGAVDQFHGQHKQVEDSKSNGTSGIPDFDGLDFRKLLGRFVDVCQAMEYAHSRGVLHRDLKPGNIMLGKYGETLVVDWGLSKAVGRPETAKSKGETTLTPSSASGSAPTVMGSAIGTPAFMPPEQAAGRLDELGPQSDVYSLGATLYYLLTGRVPFAGNSLLTVLEKVKVGNFSVPSHCLPQVPKTLEAICLKAMSLLPEDRYQSPQAIAEDVEKYLADEPVTAFVEPWLLRARRWMRKRPALIAALSASLLIGLIGAVIFWIVVSVKNTELAFANGELTTRNEELDRANQEINTKNLALETANLENRRVATSLAVDRAQTRSEATAAVLWYVRALELCPEPDQDTRELILANLAHWNRDAVRLGMYSEQFVDGYYGTTCISRNGQRFYNVNSDGSVLIYDVEAGESRSLQTPIDSIDRSSDPHFAVSEDESVFAVVWDKTLQLWDIEKAELLGEPIILDETVTALALSSNGSRFAAGTTTGSVNVVEIESGDKLQWRHGEFPISVVAFRPDNEVILTGGYDGLIRRWEVGDSESKEIGNALIDDRGGPVASAAWSPDGMHVATGDFAHLRIWDLESEKVVRRAKLDSTVTSIAFSSSGKRAAVALDDGRVVVIARGEEERLEHELPHNTGVERVAFLGDERRIVTLTNWGEPRIWELPKQPQVVPVAGISAEQGAVSPDGRLAVLRTLSGRIQRYDIENLEPIGEALQYPEPVSDVAFSPSGNRILVNSFRGTCQVFSADTWQAIGASIDVGGVARQGVFLDEDNVAIAVMDRGSLVGSNIKTGEPFAEAISHAFVNWVATADQRLYATGGRGQIHVYDSKSWERLFTTDVAERDWFWCAASKDSAFFAGAAAQTVMLFDGQSGQLLRELPHPKSTVKSVAFSEDGRLLATIGADEVLRVWHRETGRQVGRSQVFTDLTTGLFFGQHQIITFGQGFKATEIILVDLPESLDSMRISDIQRWSQLQSGVELKQDGSYRYITAKEWQHLRAQAQGRVQSAAE